MCHTWAHMPAHYQDIHSRHCHPCALMRLHLGWRGEAGEGLEEHVGGKGTYKRTLLTGPLAMCHRCRCILTRAWHGQHPATHPQPAPHSGFPRGDSDSATGPAGDGQWGKVGRHVWQFWWLHTWAEEAPGHPLVQKSLAQPM